jgi:hypothetical protein
MTEKEFWDSLLESEHPLGKIEVEEAMGKKQFDSLSSDGIALTNKPFTLVKLDVKTANIGSTHYYSLEESDCARLLKEIPALREAYELLVPLKRSAKDFWEEFLRKNLFYQTEVFKGHDPVYIPFITDVVEYDDRKRNTQQILEARSKQEILGNKKPLIDVDFVTNTFMLDTPMGYGSYQT